MDLSGIIFAALAVGWAVYLIPKALQHNDELARTRAVSTFSGRMRVLGSGQPAPAAVETAEPVVEAAAPLASASPRMTREAARRAARRRRRVLLALVFALGMVSGLAGFAIAPVWAPAIPGGLIVVFLVVARLSVRRQAKRAVAAVPAASAPVAESFETQDLDEETEGIDVSEIRASVVEPGAPVVRPDAPVVEPVETFDEGSLWDPLPMTLPTYVTKPTARRTVRTIELSRAALTSSGHDPADTKLVREAEAARKAQQASDEAAPEAETQERKAAGA